jgi:3-methyladenine DNA glycosylase AlkD
MSYTPAVEQIIERLYPLARAGSLYGMARFGIATENALGVSMPDLPAMLHSLGRNRELALDLWRTSVRETCSLAPLLAVPKQMTRGRQAELRRQRQGLQPLPCFFAT